VDGAGEDLIVSMHLRFVAASRKSAANLSPKEWRRSAETPLRPNASSMKSKALVIASLAWLAAAPRAAAADSQAAAVEFRRDDVHGCLQVLIGGKEALVYVYGKDWDLPHFYGSSGKFRFSVG